MQFSVGAKTFIVNCLCCTSPVYDDADDAEMLAKKFKTNRLHSFTVALVSYYDDEVIDNYADADDDDDGDDDSCL